MAKPSFSHIGLRSSGNEERWWVSSWISRVRVAALSVPGSTTSGVNPSMLVTYAAAWSGATSSNSESLAKAIAWTCPGICGGFENMAWSTAARASSSSRTISSAFDGERSVRSRTCSLS